MITHSVVYSQIGQASRAEQVVERLSNAIVCGLLEAEEQLPSESELARLFGVSTVTVREALNTLRERRFIDTRRGRNGGSFVCHVPADLAFSSHPLRSVSTDYLADLGELQCAITGRSVWLASQRSTAQDCQRLAGLRDDFVSAGQAEARVQADMRYQLALAANAQSARLANMVLEIQAEWVPLAVAIYQDDAVHAETARAHSEIFEALQATDARGGRAVAESWIKSLTDHLISCKHRMQTTPAKERE